MPHSRAESCTGQLLTATATVRRPPVLCGVDAAEITITGHAARAAAATLVEPTAQEWELVRTVGYVVEHDHQPGSAILQFRHDQGSPLRGSREKLVVRRSAAVAMGPSIPSDRG